MNKENYTKNIFRLETLISDWREIDDADVKEYAELAIIDEAEKLLKNFKAEFTEQKSEMPCNFQPKFFHKTLELDEETRAKLKEFFNDIFRKEDF